MKRLSLVGLLVGVCAAQAVAPATLTTLLSPYAVKLPAGWKVKTIDGPDFVIYHVLNAPGKRLFAAYFGNFPQDLAEPLQKRKVGAFNAVSNMGACKAQGRCGEVLVHLKDSKGFPQYAHFFYEKLSLNEEKQVWNTINTLVKGR